MSVKNQLAFELVLGFLAYGLGILGLNYFQGTQLQENVWLLLLPCLPIIYIASVIVRAVAALDELQRKIVMEAMAFSGLATGFVCFSYLFLRDMGAPEFRAQWAFYLMVLFHGVGMVWSARRYR